MEPKFEASEFLKLSEVFPGSYIVSVNGIKQLYATVENAFWNKTKRSIFHKQVLALLFESGWYVVVDSLNDESELTTVGEVLFTHPDTDKCGFIGMDINYPDEVSLDEEGDLTKLLSVVSEYIAAIDE
jgi:hypothetical protein